MRQGHIRAPQRITSQCERVACDASGLLRAAEESHVHGFAQNVSLYGLHNVCAGLEGIGAGLDIDLEIRVDDD